MNDTQLITLMVWLAQIRQLELFGDEKAIRLRAEQLLIRIRNKSQDNLNYENCP